MPETIELLPAPLVDSSLMAETPEAAVAKAITNELHGVLGKMLLEPDFRADAVPARFLEVLPGATDAAIRRAYRGEEHWHFEEYKPLHRYLRERGIESSQVQDLNLSAPFVNDITRQVEGIAPTFERLEYLHQVLAATPILDLLRRVEAITNSVAEAFPGERLEQIFGLVEVAAGETEFTLPANAKGALYFMTFVPGLARQLTRRAIANNTLALQIEESLPQPMSPDEQDMLLALKRRFAIEALTGEQWREAAKRLGESEAVAKRMALLSAENTHVMAQIRELHRQGRGKVVVDAWLNAAATLDELVSSQGRLSPDLYWQLVDSGHCFHNFLDHHIAWVLIHTRSDAASEFANPPKSGQKAFILEDEPDQMRTWQAVIDDHTRYTVDPELCFSAPPLPDVVEDSTIGSYTIDMQIGDAPLAGLPVAEAALNYWLARFSAMSEAEIDAAPPVTIRLWSSSLRQVEEAGKYFRARLGKLSREDYYFLEWHADGGGQGGSRERLHFTVGPKEW